MQMTKEQREEHFERKTTWSIVAIDFEMATATKILGFYRHKGQVLRQMWRQKTMFGEVEEMTRLLTEQAFDLMFVGLAKAEGFATGVKLRCEMEVADFVTKWLQEKTSGKNRGDEPCMPREGICLMDTEWNGCRDKIMNKNLPKAEKLVRARAHLLKQVSLLEADSKDIKHGHITRAFAEDKVAKCACCGRTSLRGDFPRFCRKTRTMSNKNLDRRELLNQAMEGESWRETQTTERYARILAVDSGAKLRSEGDKCRRH